MKAFRPYIFILLIMSLFSWTGRHPRGDSGTYYVVGKAYEHSNSVLQNTDLWVQTPDTVKIITTDSYGNFEFEVKWEVPCATDDFKLTHEQLTKIMNPDIRIAYKRQEIIMKNEWIKFANVSVRTKDNLTLKRDLIFRK
jgi:hypothetical protein